jgi:ATP-binding cassette subfamily B protein
MASTVASSGESRPYDLKQAVSDKRLYGMWKLATGYRWLYGTALLCISIAAGAKMLTYLLLRYVVDQVLAESHFETSTLVFIAVGFIGLAVVEGGFTFFAGTLSSRNSERITRRIRNYLYDHLQRLTFNYHDKHKTGELIQHAISDVDAVRRFFSEQILGIGRILLPFAINVIALLTLNVQLALISMLVIPPMLFLSAFFGKRIEKTYEHYQKQDEVVNTALQENFSGVRIVKAFARQDYEIDRFRKENKEMYERGKKNLLQHAMFWPSADIMAWTQLLISYGIGATLAIQGTITPGTYLAYAGILMNVVWPMRMVGRLLVEAQKGLVSYSRLAGVFKEDREPLEDGTYQPNGNVHGAIEFKNLSFTYDGEKTVLENINFKCEAGQTVALLGSTGSGKTSLVNLLPRFYEYTKGSLTLDGVELNQYSRGYLRQQIGVVEQEPFLFSRTIRENITYSVGREVSDEEVYAAAKAAAVHDVILTFPKGYSTMVGERGVTLSGGQKQRVALARTLLKNPRILILDDATSSVDTETEGEIREALKQLMGERTTFIIAHRIQSVMIADLILVMDKGHIVQQGTHDELIQQDGIYRQIYDLQSRIETELEQEMASVGL